MDEIKKENMMHKVIMNKREKMSVTGVEDVDSFTDDEIIAYTTEGIMTVKGYDLKINRLSIENGELEVEGEIDSIVYADGHKGEKGGFFSKIFK